MIELRQLGKRFGKRLAVTDLTLTVSGMDLLVGYGSSSQRRRQEHDHWHDAWTSLADEWRGEGLRTRCDDASRKGIAEGRCDF